MNTKIAFSTAKRIFLMVGFLLLSLTSAKAQVFSFNNTDGDHLWSNAENWANDVKPTGESAQVIITADVIVDEDACVFSLCDAVLCDLTIQTSKRLIVNDNLVWSQGGNLILENRAQLVYDDPVQVTVQKKIAAYDENRNQWNLIASPVQQDVMPSYDNGFLTDPATGYALTYYVEATHQWVDFKDTEFPIVNGQGYLYANALDTTLLFEGLTYGSGVPHEVALDYHAANGGLAGCNFVGNPFACNAFADRSYYLLDEECNAIVPYAFSAATPLPPCAGLIVKANANNESVSFSREAPASSHNQRYLHFAVTLPNNPHNILDHAMVSFNEGDNLEKFALYQETPLLYFTQDDKDLTILSIDSVDVLPMKFIAVENGTFTLHFEVEAAELSFLHLIDNMTGANIDLLATPTYTFNATTNDYASRFKLVFDPHFGVEEDGPSTSSGAFAYVANGEIVINGITDACNASVQMVDMTGRVIVCSDVARNVSTMGIAPGVYVLRLVTKAGVRTQKILIE